MSSIETNAAQASKTILDFIFSELKNRNSKNSVFKSIQEEHNDAAELDKSENIDPVELNAKLKNNESLYPRNCKIKAKQFFQIPELSRFIIKEIRIKMTAKNENILEIEKCEEIITQPNTSEATETTDDENISVEPISTSCNRPTDILHVLLTQLKSGDWDVALKALVEISRHSTTIEIKRIYEHMIEINQKIIEFLRSPRSYVCRTSCQVVGRFFETVKDTRRPEFDEIVEILLIRTADSNKFIRKDANVALDSLVLHMPAFHVIRAISQKGPNHKNDLVRITSARLFVCVVGIIGPDLIFGNASNKFTRKRIFIHMLQFLKDKNPKTRKYGSQLYDLLKENPKFNMFLKKISEECGSDDLGKCLKEMKF